MLTAEVLHRRGLEASGAGRLAEARRLLKRALERADEPDLLARIEVSLAYVEAETGDPEGGMRLCERALRRRGISTEARALARSQRGLLLMRSGDLAAAVSDLSAAIGALSDPGLVGRAHLNRGNVHLQRGDAMAARADFSEAVDHLRRAGMPVQEAKANHNLGYTYVLTGDLVAALTQMDQTDLASLSDVTAAVVNQDRAEVLLAAGLVAEADTALALAAQAYGARRLRQFQAEAELIRARSLLERDPAGALRLARRAGRRFAARGSTTWALRADAVAIEAQVARGARNRSLVDRADELIAELRSAGLTHDEVPVQLYAARVCVRMGNLEEASARIRRCRITDASPIAARLLWREVRADLERAPGRRRPSYAQLRAGLEELHGWQASFGSLDLQSGVVGHGRQLAVDGLRMAVADGRPEVLFEWSERGRMLVSRVVPVRPPADEVVAAELSELRWLQSQQPDARSREGRRLAELQREIRQHAWYGDGSGEVADPATLAEVQPALGADQALVAYVAAADRVVALVVTDADATVRDLGSGDALRAVLGGLHADLDMAGSDLPDAFAAPVRRQLAARLTQLDAVLVAPVADLLGDRRLVLTPSGVLAGVPWGLLPGLHGRAVTVTRSATSWLTRRATPLRLGSAGFVAGPRVPRAAAEVTAASQAWPGAELLTGEAATAAAVSDLAARVDVLHVSAHGRHSAENPLFSGVELVGGPWFGYDIDQLAEIPDVVLLSACEVGRSEVRFGEELVGMTTAWLHAGVRCVIASAAAVNDVVAHDVLVSVHRALGAGEDPATALAAACPAATDDAPPAPFVCFC